jgi:hypothetical protein
VNVFMTEAEELLQDLVKALDSSFISTWQSTAGWSTELDAAREYVAAIQQGKDQS